MPGGSHSSSMINICFMYLLIPMLWKSDNDAGSCSWHRVNLYPALMF